MQSVIDDPTRAGRYLADQLSEAECAEYEARFVEAQATNPCTEALEDLLFKFLAARK